ncbi:MBL fold metallo-hydrolase [Leifsonia poae]|uniref:MBL fold metallo-hydrolase n=1 Tax=Leifsonia poae TaxID=110933 RepID=UPI001CBE3CE6|nr:MBL fold metallo-hydrolase [Leifsonia poae]
MRELTPTVFALEKTAGANGYLVAGEDCSVLIDPGLASGARSSLAELAGARRLVPPVTDVVLTHYDPDHSGAAPAVQEALGVRVWLGREDVPILRGETEPPTRARRFLKLINPMHPPVALSEIVEPTEIIPGLSVLPAPGHTPGHVIVSWRGVVFVGDAAMMRRGRLVQLPAPLISDRDAALATTDLIASLRPRLVCPGHGRPDRLSLSD